LLPPINFIFKMLQTGARVRVWLFENTNMKVEGRIRGFDEFMNMVLDDAVEVHLDKNGSPLSRRNIGQMLLKGDNVVLIEQVY
ncbi:small nuclear ribonucleoprotein E, partial [Lojkania enalia]